MPGDSQLYCPTAEIEELNSHDRLVWLVLEVTVPTRPELWAGPAVHLLELILSRTDLHTSINAICGKGASAVSVPLVEDFLLRLLVATDKVVEALHMRLSTIGGEGQVVILEVQSNTWEVYQRLDSSLSELLWIADARSLQDQRGA
jgi:hypothetical protein